MNNGNMDFNHSALIKFSERMLKLEKDYDAIQRVRQLIPDKAYYHENTVAIKFFPNLDDIGELYIPEDLAMEFVEKVINRFEQNIITEFTNSKRAPKLFEYMNTDELNDDGKSHMAINKETK